MSYEQTAASSRNAGARRRTGEMRVLPASACRELQRLREIRDHFDLDIDSSYDWGDYGTARCSTEDLARVEAEIFELEARAETVC